MDNSETRAKAIRLGEELVNLLEQEDRADMLTRWMAYYIGEQLALAEIADGVDRVEVEERCFNAILALWSRRCDWPQGKRPFEKFEPIFETLDRLNADNPRPFFYRRRLIEESDLATDESQEVFDVAATVEVIDATARILIEAVVEAAAIDAATESTANLLREALPEKGVADLHVIGRLLGIDSSAAGKSEANLALLLERRIERLDSFAEVCKRMRKSFTAELKALRSSKGKP